MNKKVIVILTLAVFLLLFMLMNPYKLIVVRGESMYPTYKNGDILIGKKVDVLAKGDIVVTKNDFNETIIKRIKYVPGEVYYAAYINTDYNPDYVLIDEKVYQKLKSENNKNIFLVKDQIPKNQYYITGDNAKNSDDSRRFGSIDKKQILYKIIR